MTHHVRCPPPPSSLPPASLATRAHKQLWSLCGFSSFITFKHLDEKRKCPVSVKWHDNSSHYT